MENVYELKEESIERMKEKKAAKKRKKENSNNIDIFLQINT